MVMMTIISALTISLFLVEQDCPFIATLGGKADICERTWTHDNTLTEKILFYTLLSTMLLYLNLHVGTTLLFQVWWFFSWWSQAPTCGSWSTALTRASRWRRGWLTFSTAWRKSRWCRSRRSRRSSSRGRTSRSRFKDAHGGVEVATRNRIYSFANDARESSRSTARLLVARRGRGAPSKWQCFLNKF